MRAHPALEKEFAEGIQLARSGEAAEAARCLEKAAADFPEAAPLLWYLGGLYLHDLNDPRKALRHYRRATELTPKSEKASLGVFHSLWDLKRVDEALAEIKRYQTLTDWSSKDYRKIVAEINRKSRGGKTVAKLAKSPKAKPA